MSFDQLFDGSDANTEMINIELERLGMKEAA